MGETDMVKWLERQRAVLLLGIRETRGRLMRNKTDAKAARDLESLEQRLDNVRERLVSLDAESPIFMCGDDGCHCD